MKIYTKPQSRNMRLVAFFIVAIALKCSLALSEGEEKVINDLFQEWPVLHSVSPPWTSNASEACDVPFGGLTCSQGLEKHIIGLNLTAIKSTGRLSESIGSLAWLQHLTIEVKELNDGLPYSLHFLREMVSLKLVVYSEWTSSTPNFQNLPELTRLEILFAGYHGGFPEGITFLKNLTCLKIGGLPGFPKPHPSFYGEIPVSLCQMSSLVELSLVYSGLDNGLQRCYNKLPNLQILNLEHSYQLFVPMRSLVVGRPALKILSLTGAPIGGDFILEQSELEILQLDGTKIEGDISPALWDNTKLKILKLPGPKVGGTLAPAIGNLTYLEMIDLNRASIVGSIPPEIGLCSSLKTFLGSRTRIGGTLPSEIGNLSRLDILDLAFTSIVGSIPTSFNRLKSLFSLDLSGCKLVGNIPEGMLALPKLSQINLSQNHLSGTIPAEITPTCYVLDLSSNNLHGSIPELVTSYCQFVTLFSNALSGPINLQMRVVTQILLGNNRFQGSLPHINADSPIWVDFSSNFFSGTIPTHYRTLPFKLIDLTHNNLEGDISSLLENHSIKTIKLSFNNFSGTIPSILTNDKLSVLSLSNNRLTGTLPTAPAQMSQLSLSGNFLHGTLDSFFFSKPPSLTYLDFSLNRLEGELPPLDRIYGLSYVFLSSNNLSGTVTSARSPSSSSLVVLDLSNNQLQGEFPMDSNNQIPTLILSNNSFTGGLPNLQDFSRLSILDISNNQFSFDASVLTSSSYLQFLSAQHNRISGELNILQMKSLKSADFSFNDVTKVNFESLTIISQLSNLALFYINNNSISEPSGAFESLLDSGVLRKTSTRIPSSEYAGVVCSQLVIGSNKNVQFEYDESLFSFDQCDCDRDHFGVPPFNCHCCDSVKSGSSLCGGDKLTIERNYFIFNSVEKVETELCAPEFLIPNQGNSLVSNCLGVKIRFSYNGNHLSDLESGELVGSTGGHRGLPTDAQLTVQCRAGSSGRLCSRCDCDVSTTNGTCYFPGPGNICHKCFKVFSPSVFVPASLAVLAAIVIALSIIFFLILSSKRSVKDLNWEQLSLWKRISYRLIDLTSFGHITIMVTFVQIMIELTKWDSYTLRAWLQLVNGEGEGLGLRCLFPFLSNPIALLILRLMIPFLAIGIVCSSIGIAEIIHRFKSRFQLRKQVSELESDMDATSDNLASDTTLLMADTIQEPKISAVSYPALALATSTSLSIIKFFYFGTTMAAFEYLFYSVQKGTNKKFVQSVPWMSYNDSKALRMISIPFILLYLAIIPLGFILMSWKFRHKISSPFVRLYFGSLFENFQHRLFWWELVNVLRKLSVALFLRSLPPNNSFQLVLITFVLISLGAIMLELKPWKLAYENWSEGIGSVLLVFSFGSGRLGNLDHSSVVSYIFIAADLAFIAMCLVIIIWRCIREETSYEKMWKLRFNFDRQETVTDTFGPPLLRSISENPFPEDKPNSSRDLLLDGS